MTITLDLTPAQEARLQQIAGERGITPQEVLSQMLEAELTSLPEHPTGAQVIEYWKRSGALGVFADRPDSPEYARQLRARVWGSSNGNEIPDEPKNS